MHAQCLPDAWISSCLCNVLMCGGLPGPVWDVPEIQRLLEKPFLVTNTAID